MDTVGILGGTGLVGRSLITALRKNDPDRPLRVLSRTEPTGLPEGVSWRKADVRSLLSLERGLAGCSTVFYLPGILAESRDQTYEAIHHEGVLATLKALEGKSVERLVHLSAIGASPTASSAYLRTKKAAEEAIAASGIPFTVVRPSLVFGALDKSVNRFLAMGRTFHLLPMIGPGTARIQPVYAGDLARLMVLAAEHPGSAGKIYEAGGPRIYTYREFMETLRKSAHLKALIVSTPVAVMMTSGFLLESILPRPPLTPDVVRMALSDNVAERNALVTDFGMTLVSLESWLESGAP